MSYKLREKSNIACNLVCKGLSTQQKCNIHKAGAYDNSYYIEALQTCFETEEDNVQTQTCRSHN